jgi:hypothetical protein
VVFGGLLREVFLLEEARVSATVHERALGPAADDVRLVPDALGSDGVLVGAAELVWDRVLRDPAASIVASGRSRRAVDAPPT